MTMYLIAMSFKKILVMASIIWYAVDQASSLKCYNCTAISFHPNPVGDCFTKLAKEEFKETCSASNTVAFTLPLPNSKLLYALPNSSAIRGRRAPDASSGWKCLKMYISSKKVVGLTMIARQCVSTSETDKQIKEDLERLEFVLDSLYRCDTDFCNSSDTPRVGLLSLMSSLTLLFFTKL